MINAVLHDLKTGKSLGIKQGLNGNLVLITESEKTLDGVWNSEEIADADSVDVAKPNTDGSLMIRDIVVTSAKKVANSTVEIRVTDDTNIKHLFSIEAATIALQFRHNFPDGLKLWKNAKIQIITDQAGMAVDALVSYVKIKKESTLTFDEWVDQQ